jgi:asparagine synthase (glutamine-hydrolysing)
MGRPLHDRMTRWNALFFADLESLLRPEFLASIAPVDKLRYLEPELPWLAGRSTLSQVLHANFTSYLPDDLLVKTDRCTMANSLEARAPFLDRELVEYVASLPDDCKLQGSRTKAILRDAFPDLVPAPIQRRGKMGFGVPLGTWFRGELRDYMRDLLLAPDARYRDILSAPFVEGLIRRHLDGRANLGQQLWTIICFELWLRQLPEWNRGRRGVALDTAAPSIA